MPKKDLNIIKVKQIKSLSGIRDKHRKSVKGLGLKKINHIVELIDAGNKTKLLANIAGITPAIFTLSGK